MNIYILMDWNRYIHVCVMNTTYHNLACSKIRKLELRYHHLSLCLGIINMVQHQQLLLEIQLDNEEVCGSQNLQRLLADQLSSQSVCPTSQTVEVSVQWAGTDRHHYRPAFFLFCVARSMLTPNKCLYLNDYICSKCPVDIISIGNTCSLHEIFHHVLNVS